MNDTAPDVALPLRVDPAAPAYIFDANHCILGTCFGPSEAERLVSAVNNAAAKDAEIVRLREAIRDILDRDDEHDVFDSFGLADSTDNNGRPYQSQQLADVLNKTTQASVGACSMRGLAMHAIRGFYERHPT